jgi:proteasome accessory factor A
VLFSGAGRVGSSRPNALTLRGDAISVERPAAFQLSQRADFIVNDCFEWVQHSRAILNLRDEPLADRRRFRRLHLIHGDTNVLPAALFLKVGTTRLVLGLLELNALPSVALADPVACLRALSRQVTPPWQVPLANGRTGNALDLLDLYYQNARRVFAGRDAETDAILRLWARVQEGLATDPIKLVGLVDWVTKEFILSKFCDEEGLDWDHPWLLSQDLEYHHIDPRRSLGLSLSNDDGYWKPVQLERAMREAPRDSRANARSRLMREIQGTANNYFVDWTEVAVSNQKRAVLSNPFQA